MEKRWILPSKNYSRLSLMQFLPNSFPHDIGQR